MNLRLRIDLVSHSARTEGLGKCTHPLVCIYLLNPSATCWMWNKVNFYAEHSCFELRIFLLLHWIAVSRLKKEVCPIIYWVKKASHVLSKDMCKAKHNQPCLGFELRFPIPFEPLWTFMNPLNHFANNESQFFFMKTLEQIS